MSNPAESHISFSRSSSYFNEFPLQEIFDLDLNTTYPTMQENNVNNYNHMHTMMSKPIQPPSQNHLFHQDDFENTNIASVNEAVGSCVSEELVSAPIADSSAMDNCFLSGIHGTNHGINIVAQEINPCAAVDMNIIETSTVSQVEKDWITIGKILTELVEKAREVSNEPAEELCTDFTNISGPSHHVSPLIINDYRLIEPMKTDEFEIDGGVNGREFSIENEIRNYYNYDSVAEDEENRPNNANVQQLSANEDNKFENRNEFIGPQKQSSDNIIIPLAESNIVYKCDSCNKTFTAKYYLTQHINSKHSKRKLLKCHICGKRYANADALNEHLSRHSGDKPKKCPMCIKSFNHTVDLKRHLHTHFGTKPHTCEICGKGFVRKDHMLKHTETHRKRAARNHPSNSSLIS